MGHYTHYTTEKREMSKVMLAQGFSLRAIARKLNRSPSTVSREIKRNQKADGTYSANHADKLYKKRRLNCGKKPILTDGEAREYVLEKLDLRWSPNKSRNALSLIKSRFQYHTQRFTGHWIQEFFLNPQRKLCASSGNTKSARVRINAVKYRILFQFTSVLRVLKIVRVSDIGKATLFWVSEKQAVSVRTSSVKAVFL